MFNIYKKVIDANQNEAWLLDQVFSGSLEDCLALLTTLSAGGDEYRAEMEIVGGAEVMGEA